MEQTVIYPVGDSEACAYAADFLQKEGFTVTDHPMPEISHILLDIPCTADDNTLSHILSMLPSSVTIAGGKLSRPILQQYRKMDFLTDPFYLAENAAITAQCALALAFPYLKTTFADIPTLILGWGRIGKVLASYLAHFGCPVTVAARNPSDRALIRICGLQDADYRELPMKMSRFRLIFNTVPCRVLNTDDFARCSNCIKIDLASSEGIPGEDVIPARGLPGRYAPESSGQLIAKTFTRLWMEEQA